MISIYKNYLFLELANMASNKNSYLVHHWPLNGKWDDKVGGANATAQHYTSSTTNRYKISYKAVCLPLVEGYFTLPPKVYITPSDFTITVSGYKHQSKSICVLYMILAMEILHITSCWFKII